MHLSSEAVEPSESSGCPGRRRRRMAVSIVAAALAALLFALVFFGGVRRGMDHAVELYPNDQWAIAIALSDVEYGLNAGYLGYATVLHKLQEVWGRGTQNFHDRAAFVRNNSDRDLINEAIRQAASLGPQEPGYVSDGSLVTMIYSDIGYVDFVKMAFRLFGFRIEALYYNFFLVLALSCGAYLIAFWSETLPKIMLLLTLSAFFIELHTAIFDPVMPSFTGLRHASVLALVPLWHFAFLALNRRPVSAIIVVTTLIQLAVLLLAIKMRGTAAWVVVFLVLLSAFPAVRRWRRAAVELRTWPGLARGILQWPIVVLIFGLLVHGAYANSRLHPVYFTDDVLSYHEFWEAAYIGILFMAPELLPADSKALEVYHSTGNADQAGYTAAAEYLIESRFMRPPPDFPQSLPPTFISPWTGTLKFRLNNEIMRRVVFDIAARHPFGILKLYLYTKPISTFENVGSALGSLWLGWPWLLVAGASLALVVWAMATGAIGDFPGASTTVLVGSSVPFAALPNIWAFPLHHVVADLFLVVLILLQVLICAVLSVGIARLRPWTKLLLQRH